MAITMPANILFLFFRVAGPHPLVDFADLELPSAADLDSGHTALFDPGQAGVAGDAEVFANLVHRVPALQFSVYHIHISLHFHEWI